MRNVLDEMRDQQIDMPVILFEHVCKDYKDDVHAVKDVSFRVEKGEFVFIVGASGSGKSTLIKLMLREIKPTSGKVFINGRDLGRMRRHNVAKYRRTLGVVFQDFRLLQDRTVYENVAFAQRVLGVSRSKIKQDVPRLLARVGLSAKYKALPNQLSGGEQQRVAIARALINHPDILLCDEPTGNLDANNAKEVMALLDEINREGTTVVVVTHSHEIVEMMGKRVIVMNRGDMIDDGMGGDLAEDIHLEEEISREESLLNRL